MGAPRRDDGSAPLTPKFTINVGSLRPDLPRAEQLQRIARTEAVYLRKRHVPKIGRCEACGWVPPDEDWSLLDLHHLAAVHRIRSLTDCERACDPENIVVLCPTCHRIAERMRSKELSGGRYQRVKGRRSIILEDVAVLTQAGY